LSNRGFRVEDGYEMGELHVEWSDTSLPMLEESLLLSVEHAMTAASAREISAKHTSRAIENIVDEVDARWSRQLLRAASDDRYCTSVILSVPTSLANHPRFNRAAVAEALKARLEARGFSVASHIHEHELEINW